VTETPTPNPSLPPPLDGQQWVKLRAVADLLGVHYQTAWRWQRAGVLPKPIRVRGRAYYSVADLTDFLKRHRPQQEPAAAPDTRR
jgi:hypothetical protein